MDGDEAGATENRKRPEFSMDGSLKASIERLIVAGKDLAQAELAWARLKGLSLAVILRRGLLFAMIALAGLIVGLTLLLVAAVVALTPLTGLLGAALIISAVALMVTLVFGLLAYRAFNAMFDGDKP